MQYQDPKRRALLHGRLPRRLPRLALHDQGPEAQALGEAPGLDRRHREIHGHHQPPLSLRPDHRLLSVPLLDLVQEIHHREVLAAWLLWTAGSSSLTSVSKPRTRPRGKNPPPPT